ncbi:MAG: TPM domain-containing protein [Clostridium sp.]
MNKINRFSKVFISSLLLFIVILSSTVYATEKLPTPTSYKYINDYTNTLTESDSKSIISIGKELEDKTGAQAVVVVVDSTNGIPIDNYAIDLFRGWGLGQKDKDNGLLLLVAIKDKKWRVEVGRGLEGAVPDALSDRVMQSIAKPKFLEGNYNTGIIESYSSLCDFIAKEYNVTLDKSLNIVLPNSSTQKSNSSNSLFMIGGFVILVLLDVFFNRGRVFSTLLQLIFLSNINRRGPRGGGGGYGGGSGGGFGGFGGGSSNGGGSSGGW